MKDRSRRATLAGFGAAPLIALAGIQAPLNYTGTPVSEDEKVAFLFHDGTYAHLVIGTLLYSQAGLPPSIAWVIPLPSLPAKYEEAPDQLFAELEWLVWLARSSDGERVARQRAAAEKLIPLVSDYKIQPIAVLPESGGEELNAWLKMNRYRGVRPATQRYYLKSHAAFVGIRADGLRSRQTRLKALHMVYRDSELRMPLKLSAQSGTFDVTVYTMTSQLPSLDTWREFGLRRVETHDFKVDTSLATRAPNLAKLIGNQAGFITEFRGEHLNGRCARVAEFDADPSLMPDGAVPAPSSALGPAPAELERIARERAKRAWLINGCYWREQRPRHGEDDARARTPLLFSEARELEKSDAPLALKGYIALARAGDAEAASRAAQLYDTGVPGVARDYAESRKWYQVARMLGAEVPAGK